MSAAYRTRASMPPRGEGGAGDPPQQTPQQQQQQPCPACQLPPDRCPGTALASPPPSCAICAAAFAPGAVGYPDVADANPAETWVPPGYPTEAGICDDDGHPLAW